MKKGVCKSFNGIMNEECAAGINYRNLVGGDDFGWVKRTPCFEKNITLIRCSNYSEPTQQEIDAHEKELQETMRLTTLALQNIREKHPWCEPAFESHMDDRKKSASGKMKCPKCGKDDALHYSISAGNHHIWGRCETDGCLGWMM